jgi:ribosomal protein S6E (S10)
MAHRGWGAAEEEVQEGRDAQGKCMKFGIQRKRYIRDLMNRRKCLRGGKRRRGAGFTEVHEGLGFIVRDA